jgi:hypothetical protein
MSSGVPPPPPPPPLPATPQREIRKATDGILQNTTPNHAVAITTTTIGEAATTTTTAAAINDHDPSPGRILRLQKRALIRISTPDLLERKRRRFEEKQALSRVGGPNRTAVEEKTGAVREFNFTQ